MFLACPHREVTGILWRFRWNCALEIGTGALQKPQRPNLVPYRADAGHTLHPGLSVHSQDTSRAFSVTRLGHHNPVPRPFHRNVNQIGSCTGRDLDLHAAEHIGLGVRP